LRRISSPLSESSLESGKCRTIGMPWKSIFICAAQAGQECGTPHSPAFYFDLEPEESIPGVSSIDFNFR
jgi:hypothetical protein